jgi:hypothetical protein
MVGEPRVTRHRLDPTNSLDLDRPSRALRSGLMRVAGSAL